MRKAVLRVIDANFNRSREGLRVCEEISRFILNSASLTGELKAVRHKISELVEDTAVEFRDVGGDLGRLRRSYSEMRRRDFRDIFEANIERVKESLRVLEEFFKTSSRFTALRFRVYDIEKRALKRIESSGNLR